MEREAGYILVHPVLDSPLLLTSLYIAIAWTTSTNGRKGAMIDLP